MREVFCDTAVPDTFFSDQGPPFCSAEFQDFLRRWRVRWQPSSPQYPQSNAYAELSAKSAEALVRKCWNGRELDIDQWVKGILQYRNTPHKTSELSPAILLYGHPIQDCVPAHKSAFQRSWYKELAQYDKNVTQSKQNMEKFYNKGTRTLPPLFVGDPVVVQNKSNKQWDRQRWIQEGYCAKRRYLIRLTSGPVLERNSRFIPKRFHRETVQTVSVSLVNPIHILKINTFRCRVQTRMSLHNGQARTLMSW